jgi:hypothetical protein
VLQFLSRYNSTYTSAIVTIGKITHLELEFKRVFDALSLRDVSIAVALYFWERADGVMLIKADQCGYELAVVAVPLASYLNIPVIVTHEVDSTVKAALQKLKVKYSIVCGELTGYRKTMKFSSASDIDKLHELIIHYIAHEDGLNTKVAYLTIANPLDTVEPEIITYDEYRFEGEVYHTAHAPPGVVKSETYELTIPDEYKYALLHGKLRFRPHKGSEIDGERMYVFVMYENPETGELEELAFCGTPAGYQTIDECIVEFDMPFLNASGNYVLQVIGRMTYNTGAGGFVLMEPVPFTLDIRIDSLSSSIYPLVHDLSSLAPYLTAYRTGVVLASPTYALHYREYTGEISECRDPAYYHDTAWVANWQALRVHNETVKLLAKIAKLVHMLEVDPETILEDKSALNLLAEFYYNEPVYIGIIADTNMVPHYYYKGGMPGEGCGETSDNIYADINLDTRDPYYDVGEGKVHPDYPDVELPCGRLTGWDTQDVSALLARTFFYYNIIDTYVGHDQDPDRIWKNNGYAFLGSEIPVETMYGTLLNTTVTYLTDGGFTTVKQTSECASDIKNSYKFQIGSNFVLGGVHGFYYWYVPWARWPSTAGGSAYDVNSVLELAYGPSTFFLVSCVTGRIDGLNPRNCLSLAYLHMGINAYVGATRTTYGWIDPNLDFDYRYLEPEGAVLLSERFTYKVMHDATVGLALRDAKNGYLPEDTAGGAIEEDIAFIIYAHYVVHGDPAFDPYEPANEGGGTSQ